MLNKLRSHDEVDFKVYDRELPEMRNEPVDMKLLILAKHLEGKVVTGDFNLNKVAKLQNVPVINLNEIANTLKPVFLPGEEIRVKIVKAGESDTQGVGYLYDGTMRSSKMVGHTLVNLPTFRSPVCCKPARAEWFSENSSDSLSIVCQPLRESSASFSERK